MPHRTRAIVLLLVAGMLTAACGQKSGVAGTGGSAGEESTAPATSGGSRAPARHEAGANDTAGVSANEIVIGVHAPVTGAAPIPQKTFDVGKDIYWKFLAQSDPQALGGRKVRVVFRDDQFNPNQAVAVCREMVEKEKVFILVGAAGADQITACAKYADSVGVPYFSAGVNETGLADLSTYYALSLTYAQQTPLLLDLVAQLKGKRVAAIIEDTPSFDDAHRSFISAAKQADLDVVVDDAIAKDASAAQTLAEINKAQQAKAEVIYLLTSPLVYLGLASSARNQGYHPTFIGPGITNGINQVLEFGCPSVGDGQFLSPYPELNVIDQLAPEFRGAYRDFGGGTPPDDIGLALWGLNQTLAKMFEATGSKLGRAALMNTIEQQKDGFTSQVFPPVTFTPKDHFGGSGAFLLKADCAAKEYTSGTKYVAVKGR
jgi:ABC-type branched-subunit amino acid transport system substrate-binding protein